MRLSRLSLLPALLALPLAAPAQGRGPGGGGGAPGGGGMGGPGGGMPRDGGMGAPGANSGGRFGMPGGDMSPMRGNSPMSSSPSPPRSGPTLAPLGRFWDDRKTAHKLDLRSDQQHRMDEIFAAGKGSLVTLYMNLQREEARAAAMPNEDLQDEGKVFAAIDRIATARAELEKANARLLIQIRKELDADQLAKLDQLK